MTINSKDDKKLPLGAASKEPAQGMGAKTTDKADRQEPQSASTNGLTSFEAPGRSPWKAKWYPVLRNAGFVLVIFLIISGAAMAYTLNYLVEGLPEWDPDKLGGDNTSFIYDANGQVIDSLHGEQNRIDVGIDQVPPDLVHAFVATEDQGFYDHYGFNVKGILRALYYNSIGDNPYAQGASTITQQLARNAFLTPDKTWERKGKEIILAIKIERNYTKDEIMEMYLNKIYFGAGAYGIQAAAMTFFSKSASDLTLPECTFLAGLVQSPSYYNPFLNYDAARVRQKDVLDNMVSCGYLSAEKAKEVYAEPVVLLHTESTVEESHFGFYRDAVIDEAAQILGGEGLFASPENAIYRAGLHIYTAMEPDLQSYIEEIYPDEENFPGNAPDGSSVQSSATVVKTESGEVVALIGGRQYGPLRGFNRATSGRRQPGSSIKPITVYSPALELGYTPDYTITDRPILINLSGEKWQPENVNKSYMGSISMDTAVTNSVNTYAVQLLQKIGIDYSFNFAETLGLHLEEGPGPNDYSLAPLALGGLTRGTTTMEMAGAYATFGNGGYFNKPHLIKKIVDRKGNTIYEYKDGQQVMSAESATQMVTMLEHVVSYGTGTRAKVSGVPTGGKTGTSESYADSWFVGLTPTYSCAVWMGYDVDYHMGTVYGGGYPAMMFRLILTKAHENLPDVEWVKGNKDAVVTRLDPIQETHDAGKITYLEIPDPKKDETKPDPNNPNATTNGTNSTNGTNHSNNNNNNNSSSNTPHSSTNSNSPSSSSSTH